MNTLLTLFLLLHTGYVLFMLSQLFFLPAPDEEPSTREEEEDYHHPWHPVDEEYLPDELVKVSVVIPIRNEARHLVDLVKSLSAQTYPKSRYEVIIMDDQSTDESGTLLKKLKKEYADMNLRVYVSEPQFEGAYKKQALAQGIQKAKGSIILQTDGDVIVPPMWIEIMTANFDKETVFLAGGVRYFTKNIFSELQGLEMAGLVGLSASGFGMQRPFLCNGANIAFRKSAYKAVSGYAGIDKLASGDDLLLLQKMEQKFKGQSKFVFSREVIVDTYPCENLGEWWSQRRRWVSKSLAYFNWKVILGNLIAYFYHVGLALLPILCFWNIHSPKWDRILMFGGIMITKTAADGVFLYASTRFLERKRWLRWLILGEMIYPYYVMMIGFAGIIFRKYPWKGRIQR